MNWKLKRDTYIFNILTLLIIKIKYINFNYKHSGGIIVVYEKLCAILHVTH